MLKQLFLLPILAAAGLILTAQVVNGMPRPDNHPSSPCKRYILFTARDQSEPQGPSSAFEGMIKKTLATIPDGDEVDIVYPADPSVNGAHQGLIWLEAYLDNALKSCPHLEFALLGYGQGAILTSLAGARYFTSGGGLKAVVMAGNLMHTPNRKGNVDENGGSTTAGAKGPSMTDNPPPLNNFADSILDICFTGDPYCDFSASDLTAHSLYGQTDSVQSLGATFLTGKLSH
ncbi:unnamed protein product [Tilletia controversa]|uniref:Cutinase n=3 Tax=Tilletia TaxID=13289 RepID=A0A8X7MW94_9BASI|nr:hypothetical protein CF335_g5937 [Tilletia laevis]KAE8201992.1 hypothetical protein CF328_g2477 [Tilletia controversa]KAE8253597.1 hypothetical protein A4X03_0g5855 [Tilletia caries]KAE8196922.1 hypothetical protein CF336_g2402 [Tilletia laevis]KAE8251776.1 hypothetical protein A4X06_0g2535 [Tilletia controversa]